MQPTVCGADAEPGGGSVCSLRLSAESARTSRCPKSAGDDLHTHVWSATSRRPRHARLQPNRSPMAPKRRRSDTLESRSSCSDRARSLAGKSAERSRALQVGAP